MAVMLALSLMSCAYILRVGENRFSSSGSRAGNQTHQPTLAAAQASLLP